MSLGLDADGAADFRRYLHFYGAGRKLAVGRSCLMGEDGWRLLGSRRRECPERPAIGPTDFRSVLPDLDYLLRGSSGPGPFPPNKASAMLRPIASEHVRSSIVPFLNEWPKLQHPQGISCRAARTTQAVITRVELVQLRHSGWKYHKNGFEGPLEQTMRKTGLFANLIDTRSPASTFPP